MDAAQSDAGIAGSWAGGVDGMQVTNDLLGQVDVGNSLEGNSYGCAFYPLSRLGSPLTSWTILLGGRKTE